MKRIYLLIFLLLLGLPAGAQVTEDYAVEVTASVSESPVFITLNWKLLTVDSPTYTIYKKSISASSWTGPIATLPYSVSTYTDSSVIIDSAYEYEVMANGTVAGAALLSTGYIYAGIRNPAIHNRGTLLLLIDSTFSDSCAAGLQILMQDLSGDGWQLVRHDIARTAADTDIKAIINHDYTTYANVNAAFIVGHLAVPYSGDFDTVIYPPDGHVPYHDGAWPSDIYYSCITTGWTDVTVNNTLGSYTANWNIPGDGKWDQIFIPVLASLQLGRIDFNNMPDFAATEVQMMNSYLSRDHIYKMDSLFMCHRAVLHDDFGAFGGEAFAANGWRNFSPLVTNDSLTVVPANMLINTLADSTFQWAYGCGGGSFTSAGGIGSTTDFASNPINGIFTMLFGSYFADWNVQNNFLRAPLCATTPALTCCWAGRPNWFFHHMSLGWNIGYSAMLSQNNDGTLYQPGGYGNQFIHVALMGDPSLRTNYIKPPGTLVVTPLSHSGAMLSWTASPDTAVIGYYVYRADSAYGYFQRLDTAMLTTTLYHDMSGVNGLKYYMVRPVKLQSTPSGRYYNLGVGITDTATVTYGTLGVTAAASVLDLNVFPNPASNYLNITVNSGSMAIASIYLTNIAGERLYPCVKQLKSGANNFLLNISGLAPGLYMLVLESGNSTQVKQWVKL